MKFIDEERLEEVRNAFAKLKSEYINRGKDIFDSLNDDDKIALMSYISDVFYKHIKECGTYRYLIYELLDLPTSAYAILQLSGLLDVHNSMSCIDEEK